MLVKITDPKSIVTEYCLIFYVKYIIFSVKNAEEHLMELDLITEERILVNLSFLGHFYCTQLTSA